MKRAVILLLAIARPALADESNATVLYDNAEQARKANKWPEACDLYAASYKEDPQLGVLLHLADCEEHVGRVASAWAHFTDAADLAHDKHDNRELTARKRATTIAPKLPKLHLVATGHIDAIHIERDGGVDITAMIDRDLPIDPGNHVVTVTSPDHVAWDTRVTIPATPATTRLELPATLELVHRVEPPPPPPPHVTPPPAVTGTLRITSQADAAIYIDGVRVATGHYETHTRGRHHVRVSADDRIAFDSDPNIDDTELHTIDAQLLPMPHPAPDPTLEVGVSLAPGKKLRGDKPSAIAYRADVGFRIGPRVDLGAFVELGILDTRATCGFDLPGPMVSGAFDYGLHYQMTNCRYVMPGLELFVHVLPRRRIDPYVGLVPALRFQSAHYTPYIAGEARTPASELYFGYVIGARVGVDLHPSARVPGFELGPFAEIQVSLRAQESCKSCEGGDNVRATFTSIFAGLRSSWAF